MARFYRIQPKGAQLRPSSDWDGKPLDPPGLFVFTSIPEMKEAVELWRPSDLVGTEVVEIAYNGPSWEHRIESGTLIDPAKARIVKRTPTEKVLGVPSARRVASRWVRGR